MNDVREMSPAAAEGLLMVQQADMRANNESNQFLDLFKDDLSEAFYQKTYHAMRAHKGPTPNYELDRKGLSSIHQHLNQYEREERFFIADETVSGVEGVGRDIDTLKINGYHEATLISPEEYRTYTDLAAQKLLTYLKYVIEHTGGDIENTHFFFAWRASMTFAEAANKLGFSNLHHLGIERDEETLSQHQYFPADRDFSRESIKKCNKESILVLPDFMDATLGTKLHIWKRLERILDGKVCTEQVMSVGGVTAPEGADRFLSELSGARMITGSRADRLNDRGFIVSGSSKQSEEELMQARDIFKPRSDLMLGDQGDNYLKDINRLQYVLKLKNDGVLNDEEALAFMETLVRKA